MPRRTPSKGTPESSPTTFETGKFRTTIKDANPGPTKRHSLKATSPSPGSISPCPAVARVRCPQGHAASSHRWVDHPQTLARSRPVHRARQPGNRDDWPSAAYQRGTGSQAAASAAASGHGWPQKGGSGRETGVPRPGARPLTGLQRRVRLDRVRDATDQDLPDPEPALLMLAPRATGGLLTPPAAPPRLPPPETAASAPPGPAHQASGWA